MISCLLDFFLFGYHFTIFKSVSSIPRIIFLFIPKLVVSSVMIVPFISCPFLLLQSCIVWRPVVPSYAPLYSWLSMSPLLQTPRLFLLHARENCKRYKRPTIGYSSSKVFISTPLSNALISLLFFCWQGKNVYKITRGDSMSPPWMG